MVSKGDYVAIFVRATKLIFFGKVDHVEGVRTFVEVGKGHYYEVEPKYVVLLPMSCVGQAMTALKEDKQIKLALSVVTSAPILVTAAAAPGLTGGVAMMNGVTGLGSYVGAGAVGGIVIIAAAPALLGTARLANVTRSLGADMNSTAAATGAGAVGGGLATFGVVAAVAEGGTVVGLSGSGITSGLAALGGGSLASGGGGMAAGFVVCAAVPLAGAAVCGLLALGGMQLYRTIAYDNIIQEWKAEGGLFPPGH